MKLTKVGAAMLVALASGAAQAQSDITITKSPIASSGGPYAGIAMGNTSYDDAGGDDLSLSVFGGYALNDILAVEVGWSDFGSSEIDNSSDQVDADALLVSLVGNMSLGDDIGAFAQLGMARWNYAVGSEDENDTDVFFGLGLEYWVSGNASLRFAYNNLKMESKSSTVDIDETLETYQAGVIFHL